MITELEIEGFKSFGSQKIKLGPMNFIVGANASGKTNFLSALQFLQNALRYDLQFSVNELGGANEVRSRRLRQRKNSKPIRLRLKLEVDKESINKEWRTKSFDYELRFDFESEKNTPRVSSEYLEVSMLHKGNDFTFLMDRKDPSMVKIKDPSSQDYDLPVLDINRLALAVVFFSFPCEVLREFINQWRFYNIIPNIARQPAKEWPGVDLGSGGQNLAVILHYIEQNPESLQAIASGLKGVVPDFKGIKTEQLPIAGMWTFQVVEEGLRRAINPVSVSDGTIRLLALMVITTSYAGWSPLIAIEEPENGIHPHLAEHLVEIFRAASNQTQLLITTHSPSFLDYLRPDEVILCDKVDGFTKMMRASDVTEIEKFRKHFTLGELWTQGAIGGIP